MKNSGAAHPGVLAMLQSSQAEKGNELISFFLFLFFLVPFPVVSPVELDRIEADDLQFSLTMRASQLVAQLYVGIQHKFAVTIRAIRVVHEPAPFV